MTTKSGSSSPRNDIPLKDIIAAVDNVQISMPGYVLKTKKKFRLIVLAKYKKTSGVIVVRVIPMKGWTLPREIVVHYISICRASGQTLKHREHFSEKGDLTLLNVGHGDYILKIY